MDKNLKKIVFYTQKMKNGYYSLKIVYLVKQIIPTHLALKNLSFEYNVAILKNQIKKSEYSFFLKKCCFSQKNEKWLLLPYERVYVKTNCTNAISF